MKIPERLAPLGLALLLLRCTGQVAPTSDLLGAYNQYGGAHRSNDYSRYSSIRVSNLQPVTFKQLSGGLITPPLPVMNDQTILLLQNGLVAGVGFDSVYWTRHLGAQFPGLAADSSGQIYMVSVTGLLSALHANGSPAWTDTLRLAADSARVINYSTPLGLPDGVVIGSTAGDLWQIGADGGRRWGVRRGGGIMPGIAADPALGIVAAVTQNDYSRSDTLLLIDAITGGQRWSAPVQGGRIISGPVIVGDLLLVGVARVAENGTRIPSIVAFTGNGSQAWQAPLSMMPRGIAGDLDGNIYIAGSAVRQDFAGGGVISLDRSGKERWRVTLHSAVPSAPVVSQNWVFFVSRQDERTGIFTYGRDGKFSAFVPISTLPDVLPQPAITPYGQILLGGIDQPVLLRGSN